MPQKKINHLLFVLLAFLFTFNVLSQESTLHYKLDLTDLKVIGEIDPRYQSYNIEMCEVVGGDFWIPYELIDPDKARTGGFSALKRTIPPIDLYDHKLRTLASALGPVYIRVSGTWANTTYFQDNDEPKLIAAPDGFENVLTREEWKGVIDFCNATDSKLVTSFAISDGIRDEEGNWTPVQIEALVNYTRSLGAEIFAAEMFNEPSHASYGGAPEGYDAAWYAKDFMAFKSFVESSVPEMSILGPGSTGEGGIIPGTDPALATDRILTSNPNPDFDIFSYHYYGGVSKRCMGTLSPENALSETWLSKTELGLKYYEEARDTYLPGIPIWLTETAEAACGGNPWAATYVDCFRYLEQLGRLAKKGVQVVMHNTLSASEYGLLEQDTHEPRPNYWVALLWSRLMGTRVYDVESPEGLDIFVHNLKQTSKGSAVLIVNHEESEKIIEIPADAQQFLVTADDILSKSVRLNGDMVELNPDDTIPEIKGKNIGAGTVRIPSRSIMFLAFKE